MRRYLALLLLFALAAPLYAQDTGDMFTEVDDPPELVGGLAGLAEQIQYPKLANLAGLEGTVLVQFVVDQDGKVTDAEVLRGIEGGGLNEEALRVVQQARFTPGMAHGEPVKVKFTIPVRFVLPTPETADQ